MEAIDDGAAQARSEAVFLWRRCQFSALLLGGECGSMLPIQFPFTRLGHGEEIDHEPNNSDSRKCKECRTVSGMDDNESGERSRQRSTYALRGDDRALCHVKAAGAAHQV